MWAIGKAIVPTSCGWSPSPEMRRVAAGCGQQRPVGVAHGFGSASRAGCEVDPPRRARDHGRRPRGAQSGVRVVRQGAQHVEEVVGQFHDGDVRRGICRRRLVDYQHVGSGYVKGGLDLAPTVQMQHRRLRHGRARERQHEQSGRTIRRQLPRDRHPRADAHIGEPMRSRRRQSRDVADGQNFAVGVKQQRIVRAVASRFVEQSGDGANGHCLVSPRSPLSSKHLTNFAGCPPTFGRVGSRLEEMADDLGGLFRAVQHDVGGTALDGTYLRAWEGLRESLGV